MEIARSSMELISVLKTTYSFDIPQTDIFSLSFDVTNPQEFGKCPSSIDSLIVARNPKRARNFNKKPRLKRSWKEYTRTKEILLRNGGREGGGFAGRGK